MKRWLFWTALPFVLPQAILLRRRAPRFAAAGGPRAGRVGTGLPLRLLAIGDSIVDGVGARTLSRALVGQAARAVAARFDAEVDWQAVGKTGLTVRRFLDTRWAELPAGRFDYVVVSFGVNDVTSLRTLGQWREDLQELFARLQRQYAGVTILFAGIPPLSDFPLLPEPLRWVIGIRGRDFDAAGRAVASELAPVVHVPIEFDTSPGRFAADGFHPSEASYEIFGQAIADAIPRHPSTSDTPRGSRLSSA